MTMKPRGERSTDAMGVINRLRPKLAEVRGAAAYLSPAQDITVGARLSRALYQYTLQDASLEELNEWVPKAVAKLKTLPILADVSTDLLVNGPQLTVNIDRDRASSFGITPQLIDDTLNDALGQRQVVQYYTQLSTYNVVLEILPELQGMSDVLSRIYIKAPATGQMIPLSTLVSFNTKKTGFLSINHQSPVPRRDDLLQHRARHIARAGRGGNPGGDEGNRRAGYDCGQLPGERAGVPGVAQIHADSDRGGARGDLSHPRHAL